MQESRGNNTFCSANPRCDHTTCRPGVPSHVGEDAPIQAIPPLHQALTEKTGRADAQTNAGRERPVVGLSALASRAKRKERSLEQIGERASTEETPHQITRRAAYRPCTSGVLYVDIAPEGVPVFWEPFASAVGECVTEKDQEPRFADSSIPAGGAFQQRGEERLQCHWQAQRVHGGGDPAASPGWMHAYRIAVRDGCDERPTSGPS